MTKAVQRRKGTDSEHSTFTGLEAEITVNTTNQSVHVHDGSTAGGFELARADGSNVDNFAVGGNLTVTGNTTINGTLTLGDADTDSITINADLTSNLIPNADDTYDIGSATKEWKDIYIDGTAYIDAINFNGTAITATGAELNYVDGVTSAIQTQIDGKQDSDAQLTDIAGLTPTDGNFIVGDGANFVAESGATARTSLGLGSIATQDSSSISITGGTIDGVTIGGSSAGAGTFTTLTANTSITGTLATAAQPNITSVGTLTGFTSTGIDDNATSTAITIDSSENVGIGTGSPSVTAHISGSANYVAGIESSNTYSLLGFKASGSSGTMADPSVAIGGTVDNLYLRAGGAERMRIDSSGNVGIGTSSPSAPLTVNTGSDGNNVYIDNNGTQLAIGSTSSVNYINTQNGNATLAIQTNSTERLRVDASGNITQTGATNTTVSYKIKTSATNDYAGEILFDDNGGTRSSIRSDHYNNALIFKHGSNTEHMRIDSAGKILIGTTVTSDASMGFRVQNYLTGRYVSCSSDSVHAAVFNRNTNDGELVSFRQDGTGEGSITVSGTTVSYNGGHLSRWSQLADNTKDETIVKGTVMTNLNQMAEWTTDGVTEDNEQLNCMAVSSVEGDVNVAGVFVNWDNDDKVYTADMNVAMTGDMVIRIAQGITVAQGDLLMSAGDGTAKPQDDDIIRAKTIAKVTSTHVSHTYDDGSYLVPCVLMAC